LKRVHYALIAVFITHRFSSSHATRMHLHSSLLSLIWFDRFFLVWPTKLSSLSDLELGCLMALVWTAWSSVCRHSNFVH